MRSSVFLGCQKKSCDCSPLIPPLQQILSLSVKAQNTTRVPISSLNLSTCSDQDTTTSPAEGQITCGQCTYLNLPGSTSCEVCAYSLKQAARSTRAARRGGCQHFCHYHPFVSAKAIFEFEVNITHHWESHVFTQDEVDEADAQGS